MKVLVIGYCKTGTKTMYAALTILGYKVYDYEHNCYYLGKQWKKILSEEGGTKEDFYEMYKDVDASVDIPALNFWEEILEAFPDVKLIFMERNEEEWHRSLDKQIENIESNKVMKLLSLLSPTALRFNLHSHRVGRVALGCPPQWFFQLFNGTSPTIAKMLYRNHNSRVRKAAPKEQLLTYSVTEGWEPLCKFLGKSIPDEKFPHKNKRGTALEDKMEESPIFAQMKLEMMISFISLGVLIALIFMYLI